MVLKTLRQKIDVLVGEDRGVSPVIGVILMVAITVILAAVIGAFVLNLGNDLESSDTPTASVGTDATETATAGEYDVTFTHNGGDTFEAGTLYIVDGDTRQSTSINSGATFGTGQKLTYTTTSSSVSLVFDDGTSSSTVATIEL